MVAEAVRVVVLGVVLGATADTVPPIGAVTSNR